MRRAELDAHNKHHQKLVWHACCQGLDQFPLVVNVFIAGDV